MKRLSNKLALYAVFAACLIVPILGVGIYYTAKDLLQDAIREKQVLLVQDTMRSIDQALLNALQGIQLISDNAVVEIFLELVYQGKPIDERIQNTLDEEVFEELAVLSGPWDFFSIVDNKGIIVDATEFDQIGNSVSTSPQTEIAYEEAMQGITYYSDLILSEDTQKPTVLFAAPVYSETDPKAPIIGVVIGHYAWPVVSQILTSAEARNPIYLFNREGTVISTSRFATYEVLQDSLLESPLVQESLQGNLSGSRILPSIETPDQVVLSTYTLQQGLFNYRGSGWGLMVETPLNEALKPVDRAIQYIVVLILAVTFLVVFAFYALGRALIYPIQSLTQSVQKVAEGDMDHRVAIETNDEVENLAQTFNEMFDRLDQTTVSKTYVDDILASMIDTLIVMNPDGTIRTVNRATLDLLGYAEHELIGKQASILMPMEAEKSFLHLLREATTNSQFSIQGKEVPYFTKDGRSLPMLTSGASMKNSEGKIEGIVFVAQDISARKDAENELEQQRDLLQTTLSSIGDGVIATDSNARVTFINPIAESLTGWSFADALNKPIGEVFVIVNERSRETVENPVEKVLQRGNVVGLANHTILIAKTGREIPIDDSGAPIRSATGNLHGAVLVFRDVTERRSNEHILREAKEAAEVASVAKSQFLANMSHEIRTPLNAIVGFSQILLNRARTQSLPPQFNRYLENIRISGQHLSELINNILDLSKIEAGKMDVSMEDLNVKQLLQSIYHIYKAQALQKDLKFSYEWTPQLPTMIRCDRSKLNQILVNLTINAIKFSPSGQSVCLRASQENDQLVFKVVDTGVGIPHDKQAQIFEMFEQVDPTTTRSQEGSGLGLSITKQLVHLLGGEITVQSAPNKGATFIVKVPLIITKTKSVEGPLFPEGLKFSEDNQVLLVEDNPMNREMAMALFQELGLQIEWSGNGGLGVQRVLEMQEKGITLDLILMDIHMPEMDGLTATKKIRSFPGGKNIPIVMLSADVFRDQEKVALEIGASDYLIKPLDFKKLFPILVRYLRQSTSKADITLDRKLPPLSKQGITQLHEILDKLTRTSIMREGTIYEQLESIRNLCNGYNAFFYLNLIKQIDETVALQDADGYQRLIEQGKNELLQLLTNENEG